MTVPEIHTFTGAYAVDALSTNERESFERHLLNCEPCTTESRSLQAAAAALAALVSVPAAPSLRERVLTQTSRASQLPARTSRDRFVHTHWESSRLWMAVAATLTLVATGLGILAVSADRRADEAERQVAEIAATPREVDVVSRATRSGGTATLVSTGEDTVFAAQGLPVPGPGRAYQLWVISPPRGDRVCGGPPARRPGPARARRAHAGTGRVGRAHRRARRRVGQTHDDALGHPPRAGLTSPYARRCPWFFVIVEDSTVGAWACYRRRWGG